MAGLWFEGFGWLGAATDRDDATTQLQKFYNTASIGSGATAAFVASRTGNQAIDLDSTHTIRTKKLRQPNDANTTVIFGFYLETPATFSNLVDAVYIWGGASIQCTLETNSDGTLDFQRGTSTLLGTSPFVFSASNKYYVEFKIVVADGTSGSLEMKVADITANGDTASPASEWTITSVDTRGSSDARETSWDQIQWISWNNNTRVGDIYIFDGTGSRNNDFVGNLIVETIDPNGAGTLTQLTPSTGANWENVDDPTTPDDDGTYNTADADGETDLYDMTPLVNGMAPLAVQVQVLTRVTEGNPRKIRLPVRSGSTTEEGSDLTCTGDDYAGRHRIVEDSPDTSAVWTSAEIATMEVGIKRQS